MTPPVSKKPKGIILQPDASAFLVRCNTGKYRLSYEANREGRTDPEAFGVLDKNGNYFVDKEETPITAADIAPHAVGDRLFLKERWLRVEYDDWLEGQKTRYITQSMWSQDVWEAYFETFPHEKFMQARTMYAEIAQGFREITSCEVVRVQELTLNLLRKLGFSWVDSFEMYLTKKYTYAAWDNNEYFFYYELKRIPKL
mgnify:CR=1 FL=1